MIIKVEYYCTECALILTFGTTNTIPTRVKRRCPVCNKQRSFSYTGAGTYLYTGDPSTK